MRRTPMLATLVLATGLALPAAAETGIEAYYAWPGHKAFHERIAEAFTEAEPGITVTYRAPAPSYDEAVQTLIRQSMAGDLPDLHYVGYHLLPQLVDRGIVTPLDDLVAKEDMAALGYTDQVLALGQVGGRQYGIPFTMSTPVVFYNADLVADAGGDPDVIPRDWDAFIDLAGRIDALGDDVHGMYYELGVDDWTTQSLVRSFGGRLMNEGATGIAFDGPEGTEAVRHFKRFHTEGGQPAIDQRAARQLFTAGKLGFYFASTAGVRRFETESGDRFTVRTAELPLGVPDATMPTGGMAAVILTEDPEKRDAAWRFVKFGTGPVGQTIVVHNTGYMPTNQRALEAQHLGSFYEENPNWYTSVRQTPRARPWFPWPGGNGVEIGRVIRDEMTAIANGAKEPEVALADMAERVSALLPHTN